MMKRTVFWMCYILVLPVAIIVLLEKRYTSSKSAFDFFAHLLSLIPGRVGNFIRGAYYYHTLEDCSKDVSIDFGSFFSQREASVGKVVTIGAYVILGKVEIGDYVLIASKASIPSGRHQHTGDELSFKKVKIGDRTWIGEGAIVMDDIGKDCVIQAGTVVTQPIGDGCMVMGGAGRVVVKELPHRKGAK